MAIMGDAHSETHADLSQGCFYSNRRNGERSSLSCCEWRIDREASPRSQTALLGAREASAIPVVKLKLKDGGNFAFIAAGLFTDWPVECAVECVCGAVFRNGDDCTLGDGRLDVCGSVIRPLECRCVCVCVYNSSMGMAKYGTL